MRAVRGWLGWGAVALLPLAVLGLLLSGAVPDPVWLGPSQHFYIVSLTALLMLSLAALMAIAARQVRDARVVFLALAFLGIAGLFAIHGLTTPGALVPLPNPWVGFTARMGLFTGAFFLALGTVHWPPAVQQRIVHHQTPILAGFLVALIAFGALAVTTSFPSAPANPASVASGHAAHGTATPTASYEGYGQTEYAAPAIAVPARGVPTETVSGSPLGILQDASISRALAAVTLSLLALVIVRYALLFRAARLPLAAGILAGSVFLAQAQVSMVLGPLWHASWWTYHGLLLAAFFATSGGLAREYARSGSLQGVVEGLLLRDTIAQLERSYAEVIVALVGAVEAKDPYTRGHSQRVAALAVRIGQELRLSSERLRVLSQSAILHDIGKIGVPDTILNKPGRLTPEELALVKLHPVRGHEIIAGVRSLQREVAGVRHHHERYDGGGYPDGLAGEAIPLDARIIAVADVFDALTSARAYRSALSPRQALEIIDAGAGTQFDPRCVAALRSALPLAAEPALRDGESHAPARRERHPRSAGAPEPHTSAAGTMR